MNKQGHAIEILLIEDNPGDIRLTQEALQESKLENELKVVTNAEDALDYLYKRGEYKNVLTPGVIFMDLHLPKKNGHDILREIKNDPNLKRIPVFVLTSSHDRNDILASYNLNANCVITKPMTSDDFTKLVYLIDEFWFKIVQLPPMDE